MCSSDLKQVQQEYGNIGRGLTGDQAIDKEGFNYWYNQLQSGAVAPSGLHNTFTNAAYDVIQADPNANTSVSDKTLQQYFQLHPEAGTAYANKATTDALGADYIGNANYNTFKTDLDNKLSSGQVTASEYANQLQQSSYNKAQEANRAAGIAKSLYGYTDEQAVQLASDLYQGKSTNETANTYYNQLLTNPNKAISDILTERANASDAATNPY